MKAAVIQSNYIPWKGYFDIIHDVDLFIFYDDIQYTKNDWRNRNKIKTDQGPRWMTIPTGSQSNRLIHEVELPGGTWRRDHFRKIEMYYRKTPYYNRYKSFLEYVYLDQSWKHLSKLNHFLIRTIAQEFLGIKTKFADSREYDLKGQKSERLLDLVSQAGADVYFSGPAARSYLDEAAFRQAGIEVVYKDYTGYPEYDQRYPPFCHQVSILDLLFNCGDEAGKYIWGWRSRKGTAPPVESTRNVIEAPAQG